MLSDTCPILAVVVNMFVCVYSLMEGPVHPCPPLVTTFTDHIVSGVVGKLKDCKFYCSSTFYILYLLCTFVYSTCMCVVFFIPSTFLPYTYCILHLVLSTIVSSVYILYLLYNNLYLIILHSI